jgi:hypothetical protein
MDRRTPPPLDEIPEQPPRGSAGRRHTMFTPQPYAFGSGSADTTSSSAGQDPALDGIPLRPNRTDSWQAQSTNNWQVETGFQPSEYYGNLDPQGDLVPAAHQTMRENEHSNQNKNRLDKSISRVEKTLKLKGKVERPIQTKKKWQDFRPKAYETLRARHNLDDWNQTLLWDMLNGGIHYPDVKPEDRDTKEYDDLMDEMLMEWYTGPGKPKK